MNDDVLVRLVKIEICAYLGLFCMFVYYGVVGLIDFFSDE